jgi:cytidylate kinase
VSLEDGRADRPAIIAIDGPAGAGKTTTAKEVARRLGLRYLDTGAMYRAAALQVLRMGLNPAKPDEVIQAIDAADISIQFIDGDQVTLLNGADVSAEVRTPEVTEAVTPVCEVSYVREKMVALQRRIGTSGRFVVEGRDIGTVVFPNADLKIFMTADLQERALRRKADFTRVGVRDDVSSIASAIKERDRRDSTRGDSPLKAAPDAIVIDTTNLTFEQQVETIIRRFHEKTSDRANKTGV